MTSKWEVGVFADWPFEVKSALFAGWLLETKSVVFWVWLLKTKWALFPGWLLEANWALFSGWLLEAKWVSSEIYLIYLASGGRRVRHEARYVLSLLGLLPMLFHHFTAINFMVWWLHSQTSVTAALLWVEDERNVFCSFMQEDFYFIFLWIGLWFIFAGYPVVTAIERVAVVLGDNWRVTSCPGENLFMV